MKNINSIVPTLNGAKEIGSIIG